MKLLSMWEPWASLFVSGRKRIETRSWTTDYRGWLAIYSTRSGLSRRDLLETISRDPFRSAAAGVRLNPGYIVGVVELIDVQPVDVMFQRHPELLSEREIALGNYGAGRYGLVAGMCTAFGNASVPFKAQQGKLLSLSEEMHDVVIQAAKVACNATLMRMRGVSLSNNSPQPGVLSA